jgi:hypothetical protein
LNHTNKVV